MSHPRSSFSSENPLVSLGFAREGDSSSGAWHAVDRYIYYPLSLGLTMSGPQPMPGIACAQDEYEEMA